MSCLPPLSIFSFWPQWLAFLNSKPSLENDLEKGIADIDGREKVEIETIAATYEGDYSASFWLHPRTVQDVPRVDGFYRATVRYDNEAYTVERYGQIPWSAKGSLLKADFLKITMSKAELIANIVTRDHWLGTEDNLAGRFRRVIDEGTYWSKSVEDLDEMLAERDAELKGIYFDILRRHQLAGAGKDDYSVEMMRQSVVQLRQALKQNWDIMLNSMMPYLRMELYAKKH